MTTQRPRESLQIVGPGGWRANFRGSTGALIFTLLAMVMGVIAYKSDARAEERYSAMILQLQAQEKALKELAEMQAVMIYVLSLPMEEREKLNLLKPRALTEMQK